MRTVSSGYSVFIFSFPYLFIFGADPSFTTQKISRKFRFSTGQNVCGSDALPPKICVHPPLWSAPRRCAGGEIRGDINNVGGSLSKLITVTVQLTSARLVVWNSIDDTHG